MESGDTLGSRYGSCWVVGNDQTSDLPVAKVSNDGGAAFGPMLRLGMNSTIGATAGAEEEGEG